MVLRVIRGWVIIYAIITQSSSHFPRTRETCSSRHTSPGYEHCGTHQGGLECYGEYNKPLKDWYCLWTSLNGSSGKDLHTLVIIQVTRRKEPTCNEYNISAMMPLQIKTDQLYENYNMSVHVFDKSNPSSCPKASFRGFPKHLIRCRTPTNVSFVRHSRGLVVNVTWKQGDLKATGRYAVRYKALNRTLWDESQSTTRDECTVENLNPSLSYMVQIRCSPSNPWSPLYTLPPELNVQPVILNVEYGDIAGRNGCSLLLISWKFPSRELVKGYNVNIGKASGELPSDWITTSQPELRLIVSYSTYQLKITAFNEASTSPAVSHTIPPRKHMVTSGGKLNVTFHSNTSLTLSWTDTQTYVCYSVEVSSRGRKTQYLMFFEDKKNHKLIHLKEPLEPYRRYDVTLHTRPNRDTCNMKRINNSETTYGNLQAYFREGSAVSAPTNMSSSNVTLTSVVLTWEPVPVEDVRGFLLGYALHYKENGPTHTSTERNIMVAPTLNRQELVDLKSGTLYVVQISACTAAGAGVKSTASYFETNSQDHFVVHSVIEISLATGTVLICMICMILFGSPLLKRAKRSIWPSVPNPGISNAIQRMERSYELEPRELPSIREDCDACTLHPLVPLVPLVSHAGPADPSQRDAGEESAGHTLSDDERTATSDLVPRNDLETPGTFHSDYTTMEMFHQVAPQRPPACSSTSHGPPPGGDEYDWT